MQTLEEQIFRTESASILGHLRELTTRRGYKFDCPPADWPQGQTAKLSKDGNWLELTAASPKELGSMPEMMNAAGFRLTTSWGHKVIMYRELKSWRVWNPTMIATDSVEVSNVGEWLDDQIMKVLG
ncbi:MAG: hypothetical protein WBE20_11870 [Candidatus Acidiferrales bacterium]